MWQEFRTPRGDSHCPWFPQQAFRPSSPPLLPHSVTILQWERRATRSLLAHPCLSFWSSFSRVQEACGFSCFLSFCLHIGIGCFSPPPNPGDTPVSPPGSQPPYNGTLPLRCSKPGLNKRPLSFSRDHRLGPLSFRRVYPALPTLLPPATQASTLPLPFP